MRHCISLSLHLDFIIFGCRTAMVVTLIGSVTSHFIASDFSANRAQLDVISGEKRRDIEAITIVEPIAIAAEMRCGSDAAQQTRLRPITPAFCCACTARPWSSFIHRTAANSGLCSHLKLWLTKNITGVDIAALTIAAVRPGGSYPSHDSSQLEIV